MNEFTEFEERDAAAAALARRISARLRLGVQRRATASLIVGGGTSHSTLFRELRLLPVPWYLVTIVPSDERWVPVEDDASNEGSIRRGLLAGEPGFAHFVSLYRRERSPPEYLPELRESLAEVRRPFDSVVLDVGEDGHVASLFPSAPDLERALHSDAELVVHNVPRCPHPAVSLTLRSLLDAAEINLLLFGAKKRAMYERALEPGPIEALPVRALMRQDRVPVRIYWAP